MRTVTVRVICWLALAVGAFFYDVGAAGAQEVDARQACTPDAMRLCSDVIPDVAKVTACMMAKRRLLSVECRTAMAAGHGGHRRYIRVSRERHYTHHTEYHHRHRG
jgi:hypothetical protein